MVGTGRTGQSARLDRGMPRAGVCFRTHIEFYPAGTFSSPMGLLAG